MGVTDLLMTISLCGLGILTRLWRRRAPCILGSSGSAARCRPIMRRFWYISDSVISASPSSRSSGGGFLSSPSSGSSSSSASSPSGGASPMALRYR